jgi:type II restriction enzyme
MFFFFFNFDDVKNTTPTRSANKGEWSEVYTMFKLLGEGKLFAGDEKYNKIENRFYPILNIIREEIIQKQKTDIYDYEVIHKDNNNYSSASEFIIVKSNGQELLKMSAESFLEAAGHLLGLIKNGRGRSFKTSSKNEAFMKEVHCRNA